MWLVETPATGRYPMRRVIFLLLPLAAAALLLVACSDYGDLPYSDLMPFYGGILRGIEAAVTIVRLILAIAGLALLVAGWKIYRFAVALPGAVLFGVLGLGLTYADTDSWILAILGLSLGAVVGGFLALALHALVVFLLGGLLGSVLIGGLYGAVTDAFPPAFLLLIAGIMGGVALLWLSRAWTTALTSAIGAFLFTLGIGAPFAWILVFFVLGIVVQYRVAHAIGDQLLIPAWLGGVAAEAAGGGIGAGRTGDSSAPARSVSPRPAEPIPAPVRPLSDFPKVESPPVVLTSPSAVLVTAQGEIYRVMDGYRIGRGSACDVKLPDRSVSRNHALVRFANGRWFIQDQQSTLGTTVNGRPTHAAELRPGDRIVIGDTEFEFKLT